MGGGKTGAIALIAWNYLLQYPGCTIAICRNTLVNLRSPGATIHQFFKFDPGQGRTIKDGGVIVRRNNTNENLCEVRLPHWPIGVFSTVVFRGLDDYDWLSSSELTAVFVDESSQIAERAIEIALTRLRQRLPDGSFPKYLFLAASNPYRGWFKDWFVDGIEARREKLREIPGVGTIEFIASKKSDNLGIDESYGDFMKAVLSDELYSAMGEGSFENFEGKIFVNFSRHVHALFQVDTPRPGGGVALGLSNERHWPKDVTRKIVIRGTEYVIPRFQYAVGGLDFAGTQAKAHLSTGVVSVVLHSGRDILIDCFAGNGPGIFNRQQDWMRAIESTLGINVDWAADGTQATGIQTLQDKGFKVRPNHGKNDSWKSSVAYIRQRHMVDAEGMPKSYYLEHNKEWEKEMLSYSLNPEPNKDGSYTERPIEVNDDRVDAYRYMMERLRVIQRMAEPRQGLPFKNNGDQVQSGLDGWAQLLESFAN